MSISVDPSLFLLLNIDTADERRRPCNTLESAPSPDERKLAFAFVFLSHTSYLSVREVLAFMDPHDAEGSLPFLCVLTDMDNRLTIYCARMDLGRCRAFGKMLHEQGPGHSTAKGSVPIPQILDDALSLPTHGRMASVNGFCLGPAEESHTHDEEGDCRDDGLSESHDYSLHIRRRQSRHYVVGVHSIFPLLIIHEGYARNGETSRVNVAHYPTHMRTFTLQIQRPFPDTLALAPSFASLLE
jgi:hypothetical protein